MTYLIDLCQKVAEILKLGKLVRAPETSPRRMPEMPVSAAQPMPPLSVRSKRFRVRQRAGINNRFSCLDSRDAPPPRAFEQPAMELACHRRFY